jgi:hypothetical protein
MHPADQFEAFNALAQEGKAIADIAAHGFFWGADKRQEAMDIALEHCENAEGKGCIVVEVFRNHRHWDDDDNTGFPLLPLWRARYRQGKGRPNHTLERKIGVNTPGS